MDVVSRSGDAAMAAMLCFGMRTCGLGALRRCDDALPCLGHVAAWPGLRLLLWRASVAAVDLLTARRRCDVALLAMVVALRRSAASLARFCCALMSCAHTQLSVRAELGSCVLLAGGLIGARHQPSSPKGPDAKRQALGVKP